MKFNVVKLQTGGPAPVQENQDPTLQLQEMSKQIIESVGPEAAAALAQMIMEMLQGASQPAPQQAPMYAKKGGKLVIVGRK